MNAIITFNEDGTCSALWTEAIPLHELGSMKIERASNIEFNDLTQEWEVSYINPRFANHCGVVYSNPSRAACIAWEIENLNQQLAEHPKLDPALNPNA